MSGDASKTFALHRNCLHQVTEKADGLRAVAPFGAQFSVIDLSIWLYMWLEECMTVKVLSDMGYQASFFKTLADSGTEVYVFKR